MCLTGQRYLAATRYRLRVAAKAFDLKPITRPDPVLWDRVFGQCPWLAMSTTTCPSTTCARSRYARWSAPLHGQLRRVGPAETGWPPSLFGPGSRLQGMLAEIGIGHSKRSPGIRRWFSDGRKKEGGVTQLERSLNDDYFSDQGCAPAP